MAVAAAATAVLPPRAAALAMKPPAATAMVGAQTKINTQLKSGGAAVASAAWLWRRQRCGVGSPATAARWRRQPNDGGGGSMAAEAGRRRWQLNFD